MTEIVEQDAPEATPAAADKPGRRVWPLLAWIGIGSVILAAGTVTALGTTGALIAGGCAAGAAAGGVVLWRLPQLRKHFAGPRRASRMRSVQSRTRRMSLGGSGRKGKLPKLGGGAKKATGGKALKAGKGRTGSGSSGRGPVGRLRGAGKSLAGRVRAAGRKLTGGGKRAGGGRGGRRGTGRAGGKTSGPVRRATRRALAGIRGLGGRRASGKGSGQKGSGRKRAGKARGATAAALLPAVAAVAGAKRLRSWIRKRRGRGEKPPDKAEAPAAPAAENVPPAPPARRPGLPLQPSATDHPERRRHPVGNQIDAATEAIDQGIGSFEPENVDDLGAFLQALPAVYEALGNGLNRLADRFGDELPIHQSVVEHIREMASSAFGLHEYGGEAYQLFVNTHEDDLERLENPRPGEEFMDVSNQ